jgi:hypothetical protein
MPRDPFDDFDRHFTSTRRTIGLGMFVALIWVLFLMGAIGTGLWLLGHWLRFW